MKKILLTGVCIVFGFSIAAKAEGMPFDFGMLVETLSSIKQDENDPNKIIISNPRGNEKASISFDGENMIAKDENTGKILTKTQKNADGSIDVRKDTKGGKLDMHIDADGNRSGSASFDSNDYTKEFKVKGLGSMEILVRDKKSKTLLYRMVAKGDYSYLYDGNGKLIAEGAEDDDNPKVYNKAALEKFEQIMDEDDD